MDRDVPPPVGKRWTLAAGAGRGAARHTEAVESGTTLWASPGLVQGVRETWISKDDE